jgi:hypothetical protein
MNAQDIVNAALSIPKMELKLAKGVIVCDFCEEEVRSVGPDAVYYCDEHGCVEAYWHEASDV